MSSAAGAGYDRQITIFSPDGRLYQVGMLAHLTFLLNHLTFLTIFAYLEYAFKAIMNSGITAIAVKGPEGAVIVASRKIPDKLYEPSSITSLFPITRYIGACAIGTPINLNAMNGSGIAGNGDVHALIAKCRAEASEFEYKYGHAIPVDVLARRMAELAQVSTQQAGMRPLGVGLMLIGIDEETGEPHVFKVDPAGYFTAYIGTSIGPKSAEITTALEKKLTSPSSEMMESEETKLTATGKQLLGNNLKTSIELAVESLSTALGQEFKTQDIEVGVVSSSENRFYRKLSEQEVDAVLTSIAERD